jgi:hypothetical protein
VARNGLIRCSTGVRTASVTLVTAARPRCDENEDVYVSVNSYPDQLLKVIDLGTEVTPEVQWSTFKREFSSSNFPKLPGTEPEPHLRPERAGAVLRLDWSTPGGSSHEEGFAASGAWNNGPV